MRTQRWEQPEPDDGITPGEAIMRLESMIRDETKALLAMNGADITASQREWSRVVIGKRLEALASAINALRGVR